MPQGVRLAELIASLSLATDLGMGRPMDHALRTCLLSQGLARELGAADHVRRDVYHLALLRFTGCNAHAHEDALENGGDEIASRAAIASVLNGTDAEMLGHLFRHLGEGLPASTRARLIVGALGSGRRGGRRIVSATCEVAQMMARRLGLGDNLVSALGFAFERYDGKGMPTGAAGEAIPLSVRIASVARDVDAFNELGGWALVEEMLTRRRGRAYDPTIVDRCLEHGPRLLAKIEDDSAWDAVIAADPSEDPFVAETQLDDALACLGDFADLKCTFTRGRAPRLSALAAAAARALGLSPHDVDETRRAAFVQEIGMAGTPNGILEKPGQLAPTEWERVRMHTYLAERILARIEGLHGIATVACSHHERLDGSGYHRGAQRAQIPIGARILGAADAYVALTSERPWRPPQSGVEAAATLRQQVIDGRLDAEAVEAVLGAAGERGAIVKRTWPGGLSDREVDVLRLISRGRSNREVAEELVISRKTVGRHVENIYAKIGVSTRAGATVFALQHELLSA